MSGLKLNDKEKVISLYKFIEEFCKNKQKIITNDNKYPWKIDINNIPIDEDNISINYNDSIEEDECEDSQLNYVLKVHKPEFQKCPLPDNILKEWLIDGWNNYKNDVKVKEKISIETLFDTKEEFFEDNELRIEKYNEWISKRDIWKEKQIQ